jgi:hypothetical protein
LLDYSASGADERTDEKTNGGGATVETTEHEWPPGPYRTTREPAAGRADTAMRVIHCPNEECRALNPTTLLFCWKCERPMARGVEAKPSWSLRRALRLEKPPLRAGERQRSRRHVIGSEGPTLRAALVGLAVLLVLAALVLGAVKAWGPVHAQAVRWYSSSRRALFPRYAPVYPSSVNPPRRTNPAHPPAAAFDRNLSTYWQTNTARQVWDKIRVNFNPAAKEIDEVSIYAGDPTGTTIVPSQLQMTFYKWYPHPNQHKHTCKWPSRHGEFCVAGIAKVFDLVDTPAEQRFSTGAQRDIGQVVITIRGVHRSDNPHAKAALTDVEFWVIH